MISAFGIGRGLCDVNSISFRVTKSHVKKNRKSSRGGNIPITIKIKKSSYRYIFVVQGLAIFLTRDLATLTLISHS